MVFGHVWFWLWSARPIHLMWFLRFGGLALDADADDCASDRAHVVFAVRWSCLDADADDCASDRAHVVFVGLWS